MNDIKIDIEELKNQIMLVTKDMLKRFPNCPHTVRVLLWNDHTSLVECRYGTKEKLHISRYYNGKLIYKETDIIHIDGAFVGEDGYEYYTTLTQ